jgi:hypothetical protein
VSALPDALAWGAAAARHNELFAALTPGARIGLVAREAPASMLLWEAGDAGIQARAAPFSGFFDSGADILLCADAAAMAAIRAAVDGQLFSVLRAGIRNGEVICYMLSRRCELEVQGYEDLLDALGFAFMGACR